MVILYLLFFQFVFHLSGGWTTVLIFMCADVSLFTSYQAGRTGALLKGNGSHARVLGAGTVVLRFTSGKDGAIKERAACPLHQEESC